MTQQFGFHCAGLLGCDKGPADAIRTSFEVGDWYNLRHVLNRKNIRMASYAIISADTAAGFAGGYFAGKALLKIGNDGILIQ